ncbi:polysaccharide pyruvyl transferase family protein [Anabaena cylindrica FACHB-243]|uniref:Polysaccharide pyruvyl transferase n=1 Tax=Anabaena cylindrica (strain ATCC 27899 / PCC 7122) TaxID=272123 RepID=K9ZIV4_ANACC|nr:MULTISPECIES: polysaccharide pyruvyl transferase family protein [Anabaena]AFZ59168.1 polysaccharide pyruvyl transferase [Anabaena cylindrica PCC 7122]MBD2416518.1 polysaccharide pyruvyl transferase family protein [Anabaena cylindrica FACHB-243]MBY5281090.1 polysaccharide pyruvyl transferase family protein [Anabaena sp. CCAP 1446/1C]MBY5309877.1 polysaccharide pyruvyl transferase family protein [Anabaena sp. CCAP 1446/1C]MCM2407456.1 polysaccharide pyruvyl transferase family protein [Anabaen
MKIAVFGYYNALNAGDDRIQYSITRLLQGNTIVFLPHYLSPPQEYLQSFDWILIGGGGLVFERVGIWVNPKQWIKKCKAKIGVLGLGVNRVSQDLLVDLYDLIENSEFFYVRDEQSKSLLNNNPKVEIHPDLTWCFPHPLEKNTTFDSIDNKIAVNLVPCHWKEFDVPMWFKELSKFKLNPFPLNFNQNRDFDLLKTYFGGLTPDEFSLQPLVESQLLVGCRYHAIIFAMQMGKPFIAINYDDKVHRLLAESKLLELCLETTEYALVPEKINFILANQDKIKEKIKLFVHTQKEKSIYLTESLQKHISTTQKPQATPFNFLKTNVKKILNRS